MYRNGILFSLDKILSLECERKKQVSYIRHTLTEYTMGHSADIGNVIDFKR